MTAQAAGRGRPRRIRPTLTAEQKTDRGRRDTCTRIAECVRFLDGGAGYAEIYLTGFYPHEHRFLAEGMRLTTERVDSCIEFLTAVRKGLTENCTCRCHEGGTDD